MVIHVAGAQQIGFQALPVVKGEPLKLQFDSFLDCIEKGEAPLVGVGQASRALEVAQGILDKIEEHAELVSKSLASS